jgi:hypothetical protein
MPIIYVKKNKKKHFDKVEKVKSNRKYHIFIFVVYCGKKKEEEKEHGRSVLQGEGKLTAVGAFEPSSKSPPNFVRGKARS